MKWTIYCHTHVESGRRYVGLTKFTMMHRWNQHCAQSKSSKNGRWHFPNAIHKYGKDAFSHEVLEVLTDLGVANLAEECWIELLETRDPLKGFNLAKGGGYTPHSVKNPWDRPEYREKSVAAAKARWDDPEYRARCTAATQAQWKDPANLEANAASARSRWADDGYRERVTTAAQAALSTPEVKLRHSEGLKRAYASPEARKRLSEISKKTSSRPDVLAKLRANWDDPSFREKCGQALLDRQRSEASKTHCKNGHLYTKETTAFSRKGGRECITCNYARKKAARTHCTKGHEYVPENTRFMKSGIRICTICRGPSHASA